MDMLTGIAFGRVWTVSSNAAKQFMADVKVSEKVYQEGPYTKRTCWETKDKKVYIEHFSQVVWCIVARHDAEDLLKYIKYKFI